METFNSNTNETKQNNKDRLRPKYHFLPQNNWMNDPNGPIFYAGEYHLFYQYNPSAPQWGNIHWGHAKSKDLVYWKHLPIALIPSIDKGETDCFSGSCVINNKVPTIIYTSIGKDRLPTTGAEQWLAFSDTEMINWNKYENNPIMTQTLHQGLDIQDWRDPFIWKDHKDWYLILGGHIKEPLQPVVLLYKSRDLTNWEFKNPLYISDKTNGRNWECPNFFKLENKYLLIISPHKRVIYSIGDYKNYHFISTQWKILDHGKLYYATNGIKESTNQIILWAWIKAKGYKTWNGCLTLPRILSLTQDNKLNFHFPCGLHKLREYEFSIENLTLNNQSILYPFELKNFCFEIQAEIELKDAEIVCFKLTDTIEINKTESIGYDSVKKVFWAGKDKIQNIFLNKFQLLKIHIYIDMSIIEIIINDEECITTQIIPQKQFLKKIEIVAVKGKIDVKKLAIWHLKPIW